MQAGQEKVIHSTAAEKHVNEGAASKKGRTEIPVSKSEEIFLENVSTDDQKNSATAQPKITQTPDHEHSDFDITDNTLKFEPSRAECWETSRNVKQISSDSGAAESGSKQVESCGGTFSPANAKTEAGVLALLDEIFF